MKLQQVNLLNPQLLTPHVAFSSKIIAWMLLVVVAVGLLLYGWVMHSAATIDAQQAQAQAMRDDLQARIDAHSQPSADGMSAADQHTQSVTEEKQRVAQLKQVLTALGGTEGEPPLSARLRALANQGIPGVWLTNIEFGTGQFQLAGRALQAERIPDYLGVLARQPALQVLPLRSFSILPVEESDGDKPAVPGVAFVINPASEAR